MATFADRTLVFLSRLENLNFFIGDMNLNVFFTTDYKSRFNSDFWQIAQVEHGPIGAFTFEQPTWVEKRLMGREDQQGNSQLKTYIDYKFYGQETAHWTDLLIDLKTTWTVNQYPGSIVTNEVTAPTSQGLANLVSVLCIDTNNHPLDRSSAPLINITLDDQGRLQTDPPGQITLTLDPLSGALLKPDGAIHSLVLLELFPRIGSDASLLGVPIGKDGQPLHNLRLNSKGMFTDLAGTPATYDSLTNLPLDGDGKPVQPARLAIPDDSKMDYHFVPKLPVENNPLTFEFLTRLHMLIMSDFNLTQDLRNLVALRHRLEMQDNYLLSLNDTAKKRPHSFALIYEKDVLNSNGFTQADLDLLGAHMNIKFYFFSVPRV